MDYEKFIQAHRESDADITVAALPMEEKCATAFGLMKIDEEGRIIEFAEKPKGEQLKVMKKHKRETFKDLDLHQKVNIVVEIVKENYLVLELAVNASNKNMITPKAFGDKQ